VVVEHRVAGPQRQEKCLEHAGAYVVGHDPDADARLVCRLMDDANLGSSTGNAG
jgi:hypothetical protein